MWFLRFLCGWSVIPLVFLVGLTKLLPSLPMEKRTSGKTFRNDLSYSCRSVFVAGSFNENNQVLVPGHEVKISEAIVLPLACNTTSASESEWTQ